MLPSSHGSHRGDSNVNGLQFHSTISLGRKYPIERWAIDVSEHFEIWTSNTLFGWLHEFISALGKRPLEGLSWTSHSLRKGAATAAYSVGLKLQKMK
jgi:hypothetical protein